MELLGEGGPHLASLDVHLGLEGAWLGVIAGVDDGAVGAAGGRAYVAGALEPKDAEAITGQGMGDGGAGDSRSDYCDVILLGRGLHERFR